jgi:hypothetical protein
LSRKKYKTAKKLAILHFFLDKCFVLWYNTQCKNRKGRKIYLLCLCPTKEAELPPKDDTTANPNKLSVGLLVMPLGPKWRLLAKFVRAMARM